MPRINPIRFTLPSKTVKISVNAAVEKSSITMIFLLFTLSAKIPPIGTSTIIGIKAQAETNPNRAADFVSFNRYSGSANRKIELPNNDIICPITTIVKSLFHIFFFSIKILLLDTIGMYKFKKLGQKNLTINSCVKNMLSSIFFTLIPYINYILSSEILR